jgi:hypothetical protein
MIEDPIGWQQALCEVYMLDGGSGTIAATDRAK